MSILHQIIYKTNLSPEQPQVPVCVGDLPTYHYKTHPEMTLEEVIQELTDSPHLPGVLILKNGDLIGVLPRLKIFERLGHMYGVELYLRKPVYKLEQSLQVKPYTLAGHIRIDDAVQRALNRAQESIYDPIVVIHEDNSMGLLDMHVLLLAQSQILANLSNTVGKLEQLDKAMSTSKHMEIKLQNALELLAQVVPYHQVALYLRRGKKLELLLGRGLLPSVSEKKQYQMAADGFIYEMLKKTRQPLSIPDVKMVAIWQDLPGLGTPRSWLGVPMVHGEHTIGLLALSRVSFSPFSKDEKDISQAFASRIAIGMGAL
jgi:putative methionine-R-sulfoxide reductase with GAF domain